MLSALVRASSARMVSTIVKSVCAAAAIQASRPRLWAGVCMARHCFDAPAARESPLRGRSTAGLDDPEQLGAGARSPAATRAPLRVRADRVWTGVALRNLIFGNLYTFHLFPP